MRRPFAPIARLILVSTLTFAPAAASFAAAKPTPQPTATPAAAQPTVKPAAVRPGAAKPVRPVPAVKPVRPVAPLKAAPRAARPVAVPAAIAPAAARTGTPAVLMGISYDPARQALSIPFSGPVPAYELHQLTPTRAYFEIAPSRYNGTLTLHMAGGGEFSRVTMANHPESGATRLSFYTAHAGRPEMTWDQKRHRLLITLAASVGGPPAVTPQPPIANPVANPMAKPTTKPTNGKPTTTSGKGNPTPAPTKPLSGQPTPTKPMSGAATTIRTVYFDNARGLIVVPFTGAVPGYSLSQPQAGELAIDFTGAAMAKAPIRQELEHHPLIRRWTAEAQPGDKPITRVVLTLAASADVGVAQDTGLGAMLVIPAPLADSAPLAGPAPRAKSRIATPVFDPRSSELTLTFAGKLPSYNVLRPSTNTAYIDLPYAELIAGSMPFERVDLNPLLTFWLLAGRPAVEGQRLILHLPFGGDVRVTPDAANNKLVVKVMSAGAAPTPEPPMPTPAAATPRPIMTPGVTSSPAVIPVPGTVRPSTR